MEGLTFWKCSGLDRCDWAFGWWTGPDDDLLCVVPNVQDNFLADALFLSPVCSSRVLAVMAFVARRFLLATDENLHAIIEDRYNWLDALRTCWVEGIIEWHKLDIEWIWG